MNLKNSGDSTGFEPMTSVSFDGHCFTLKFAVRCSFDVAAPVPDIKRYIQQQQLYYPVLSRRKDLLCRGNTNRLKLIRITNLAE